MLPIKGTSPENNMLFIGGFIIKELKKRKVLSIKEIFTIGTRELSVSVDHIILALDWLYVSLIIKYNDKDVFLNEAS